MLAANPKPAILTEKDCDPPLKRKEAAVLGYWTLDELATELALTVRKVQYDVKDNSNIKVYKAGKTYLLNDFDALERV